MRIEYVMSINQSVQRGNQQSLLDLVWSGPRWCTVFVVAAGGCSERRVKLVYQETEMDSPQVEQRPASAVSLLILDGRQDWTWAACLAVGSTSGVR